jgi:Na+/H+ antiporter NhaD/arsenite permease-like protein
VTPAAEYVAAALFALAIAHTFTTRVFERLAHARPAHAGVFHLLGEVEVVFGFWAMLLVLALVGMEGTAKAVEYVDTRNFTEPLFVFAVMVVSGTRPVLDTATALVGRAARILPLPGATGFCLLTLTLAPLLGSFITEPAAMTLAALMLSSRILARGASLRLRYALLGALFVNVSIGGTLTPFAAPPVLMVAGAWGWDFAFMLANFGAKAALAVAVNAAGVTLLFGRELSGMDQEQEASKRPPVPLSLIAAHLGFLAGIVVFAHHPAIFMGLFLFFLGVAQAYKRHQDRLILREGLLVAFFLAGLVVLGGLQRWWLEPLLLRMSEGQVFFGAATLTAFTDNAALTYLGSLVQGLSDPFKYALVAGAVTGGGLTVIANAPNPAGLAILRGHFPDDAVNPLGLLAAALPPTVVAAASFLLL